MKEQVQFRNFTKTKNAEEILALFMRGVFHLLDDKNGVTVSVRDEMYVIWKDKKNDALSMQSWEKFNFPKEFIVTEGTLFNISEVL